MAPLGYPMSYSFGKVSRIAREIQYARPDTIPVDPLKHWRLTGEYRAEARWSLGPAVNPLGHVDLLADRNFVSVDLKINRAMTLDQARDVNRIFTHVVNVAATLERIRSEQ